MAKTTWILKSDGEDKEIENFKTVEEGIDAALKLIFEHFTNIEMVVDCALKREHTEIGKTFIEKFLSFSELGSANILELFEAYNDTDYCDNYYTINEDGFEASTDKEHYTIEFGKELFIETNIWYKDAEEYFLFARTKNERIRYSLYEKKALPTVANSFLVYQALMSTATPQLRKELRENIIRKHGCGECSRYECSGYKINLSDDTISNQIHTLRKLGIPVYARSIDVEDKKYQADLISTYGDKYKDGYYIDNDRPLTPDYSNLKPGSYIMLVYLTLKEIDHAHALPTQQAVIDAVRDKFGITLQRQKVKNYIDILNDLGAGIKNDKIGYWMKK